MSQGRQTDMYTYIYVCVCVCVILREIPGVVNTNIKTTRIQRRLLVKPLCALYFSGDATTSVHYVFLRKVFLLPLKYVLGACVFMLLDCSYFQDLEPF